MKLSDLVSILRNPYIGTEDTLWLKCMQCHEVVCVPPRTSDIEDLDLRIEPGSRWPVAKGSEWREVVLEDSRPADSTEP